MGECFRDTAATRAGALSGKCPVLTPGGTGGTRGLYVVARRLTIRNLIITGGSSEDAASGGGCVYVQGDFVAENAVFQNCSSRQARRPGRTAGLFPALLCAALLFCGCPFGLSAAAALR